jgi:hypothetical protein
MNITTHDFLAALYAGLDDGHVEIRLCGTPSEFLPLPLDAERLTQIEARLASDSSLKPYFGCATRVPAWIPDKRNPKGPLVWGLAGLTQNCALVPAIYVDADYKHVTAPGVNPHEAWMTALTAHPYPPSIVVRTGGGVQAYWLLTESFAVATPDTKDAIRLLLERWRLTLPYRSDDLNDTARVFRLPNTLNRKYTPARMSEVVLWEPQRRYTFDDLQAHADITSIAWDESVPERASGCCRECGGKYLSGAFVLPTMLEEGALEKGRHYTLGQFLRSVKSRYDVTWPEAWALLRVANRERVRPPIPERELEDYLKRWWSRPDTEVARKTPFVARYGGEL